MDNRENHTMYIPAYNIKAVSRLVGLPPVTLRAWERRYGLPLPNRGKQGYRLYSEHDLRTLRWLKSQIDGGLSISRAVQYLAELRFEGNDPVTEAITSPNQVDISIPVLREKMLDSLFRFDETSATEIVRRAFTVYSVDQVLSEMMHPAMIEVGERWQRGEIPVASEHFVTQFFMQHLQGMLSVSSRPLHKGVIVAACAPGETHQIGLLMIVVMLRWRGWDVKYLGPDLKLDRLEEVLIPLRPRAVLITATRAENTSGLLELSAILQKLPQPKPVFVLGGQAFNGSHFSDDLPAFYIHTTPSESVQAIERLME
jgi:methanogenic corrinoid protein MtbC1